MSVFGDFRNVWVQRFPGSDLPAAWEEDVRANLAKHKQKVAVLREELEKEEFYVEYLEQLLIDVAKHKTLATNDEEANSDDNDVKSTDRSRPTSNERSETNGNNVGDDIHSAETINSDSVNQCISELSLALPDDHSISRSNSEVPNRKRASEHRRPRCNTHPDISNYVTVIEVNEARSEESIDAAIKVEEHFVREKSPLEDASSEDGVLPDDEEPYYDSVALDGEYVYLQTALMTLPSSSPLCCSQSELQPHSPGSLSSFSKQSNYVNIDYFIKHRAGAEGRSSSLESEDETEVPPLLRTISMETDDVSGGGSETGGAISCFAGSSSSLESAAVATPAPARKIHKAEAERITMYRCIIASIIESETAYLECLNVMLQYMKAIKATLTTSQPVISEDEFSTMFYKIPELHTLHQSFLDGLRRCTQNWDGQLTIGDHFRIMVNNYGRATDTVRKCSASSAQFADITRDIRLKSLGGGQSQSLSLEDLLHKPVARVQKNALVLHDLLKYTPDSHPDHKTLNEALKMTQNFLDEFNMIQTKTMFPSADRAQRRLVKNSFIVELSDGHRKLRHLFLFNDVIACAKYKASGRDKFTFELKWYIPLSEIVIFEEPAVEPRENSPANIVTLKSQACTVRDQILRDEKSDDKRSRLSSRGSDKQRKKLADLEAQLVLASPNLVFRVGNRSAARTYTFFLSSEFERTQWIEAVHALQSCQLPSPGGTNVVSMYELQAWITACRTFLKTNMGSYLLRTGRDESLLVGDLHLTLRELQDLDQPADLFVCVEVDSYGHYFRKAKSKLVCNSANPRWNEQFIIELEGSQNLRILLYEESQDRAILRAKSTQKLSRSWLGEKAVDKLVPMYNCSLLVTLQFIPSEVTLRRVPTARTAGLFGAKIQQVCKRQKREVPFIVTACVREVERRGMAEIGIYRVSGSASDLGRLKKSFETNSYEAEQLLKEVDIHSVTGILKLYLRELPEALFTDELYPKFLEAYKSSGGNDAANKNSALLHQCFSMLPQQNQNIINYLLAHLVRVNQHKVQNKMSLHNLATVFGPTLLRPGCGKSESGLRQQQCDSLAAGTFIVMAQAGILCYFLQCHAGQQQS
ncbi:Breakpoint cluster region protein [Zootermopsis nevadensis]|uniref:Breakpoint cluster region protein n=1 Tax=Zootermopsis nevadensis TaxID=136037 RepID=A0A067RH01_ZOONE|nr:Breakpoint cluster region protein [Zootermopsis nevadensis]